MRPLRILLVEDDNSISVLLEELLEAAGHVVCGVEATETGAVQTALDRRPDLLIVDVTLRPGSGIRAVTAISHVVAIPHILMSGERVRSPCGDGIVLQKPFSLRELETAIELATDHTLIQRL